MEQPARSAYDRGIPPAGGEIGEVLVRKHPMRLSIVALLALCSSLCAGDVPGLVKVKPASGPCVEVDGQYMVPYTVTISGTDLKFEMIPVPGGEFLMGSPDSEPGHQATEGPQIRVKTRPFWMQKNEISWADYEAYMALYNVFKKFETENIRPVTDDKMIDAITAPDRVVRAFIHL
jgi:sulfatase modifying factor 1